MEDRTYHKQIQAVPGSDLHELCRELGIRQIGRKEELLRRVITHLQGEEGSLRCLRSGGSQLLRSFLRVLCLSMPTPVPPKPPEDLGLICICSGLDREEKLIQCTRCLGYQHRFCVGAAAEMRIYECPLCQMRQLDPFYQAMDDVVTGATLCQPLGYGSGQRQFLYRQEMHSKLLEPGLHRMVQIRCVRLDSDGYVQRWPKECSILINGRTIHSYTQTPQSASRKRKDIPLNITTLSPGSQNTAMILYQKEEEYYAFAIFVVEKISLEDVFNHYLYERVLTPDVGREFVRSVTRGGDELKSEASKHSLKCPLTRLMPEVPVRGWRCRHVQCFDLYAFVIMQGNCKTNRWRCPICHFMATHVVVDRYMAGIIERAKELPGCEAVEFQANGLYRLIAEDFGDGSDDDDEGQAIKREADGEEEAAPVKRRKLCARNLSWADFHTEAVFSEVLYSAECYQYAIQIKLSGVTPSFTPPPPLLKDPPPEPTDRPRSYGDSPFAPIEIN